MANTASAESPVHPTAMRHSSPRHERCRTDESRLWCLGGLCVPMSGPLAQAGMNRAFGPAGGRSEAETTGLVGGGISTKAGVRCGYALVPVRKHLAPRQRAK